MQSPTLKHFSRAASTLTKQAGDISSVFPSLSGKKPDPLPPRYSELKQKLVQGKQAEVADSWRRLLLKLKTAAEEIKRKGNQVVAEVEYSDVANGRVPSSFVESIRQRGVGIIRNVLPREYARNLKEEAQSYIAANHDRVKAFPADNPAVYELYWTPSQAKARGHPNMLRTQSFLTTLWHSSDPTSEISTTYPLTYADRLRIRQPGDAKFTLGPHTDGGSLERWEDPEYSRVYQRILEGNWEQHDPYDARHRLDANMDLYNGAGACSMFRLFQGWLSMSSTGPGEGTLRVCPLLHLSSAYALLRPFFSIAATDGGSRTIVNPDTASTTLDLLSAEFPGSVPAAAQEYNTSTHPHLRLDDTMVSIPRVEPGDYVAWHCDTIHAVDALHEGKGDSSVLYIPACAMTRANVNFLKRQRESASRWSPPPDFPGAGGEGESQYRGKVNWSDPEILDTEGKRAMGFLERAGGGAGGSMFDVLPHMSEGERRVVQEGNRILFDP